MKEAFKSALLDSDKIRAFSLLSDLSGMETITNLITMVLNEIGDEWEKGDVALSQIYMSSRICEEILDKLFSESYTTIPNNPKIAIATLMDFHFLGRRIVNSYLRANGFAILDFGGISSPQEMARKAMENKIEYLLISTLMYHAAIKVRELKEEFAKKNYSIKILVGGAPFIFDKRLWKEVGADAMGISPADAVRILQDWKQE